jgi:hypothetical protein
MGNTPRHTNVYDIDADDPSQLIAALQSVGLVAGGSPDPQPGVIIANVYHEEWCRRPDGEQCTCSQRPTRGTHG